MARSWSMGHKRNRPIHSNQAHSIHDASRDVRTIHNGASGRDANRGRARALSPVLPGLL